ncbi:MAG: hypothetical protein V4773_08645 [Verrucomicrobiota bacterium]
MPHLLRSLTLTTLVAAALCRPAIAADTASPAITRQIDALLKHRLRPEPLPLDLPNPFVLTGVTTTQRARPTVVENGARIEDAAASPNREATQVNHSEILADCAARLRIGGTIRLKDHVQIVINDTPRKEGDFLYVPYQATRIPMEIVRIMNDRIVLRYMGAEISVKF